MEGKTVPFFRSLSSQLLGLAVLFVMAVEVFIYVPSIAQFRKSYLDQRLVAAQIAALSLEEAPGGAISTMLEEELLESAEIQAVIVVREDAKQLILRSELPLSLSGTYDLRDVSFFNLVKDAFATLQRQGEGSIQVEGRPIITRHQSVQIVLMEKPLYDAMVAESGTIIGTSLIPSLVVAAVVYFTLLFFLVRPTSRVTENLTRFARKPENPDSALAPSGRKNEIGLLEEQVAEMQNEIRRALKQKTHLANLGIAVSKINHDLKNILATAQLSKDYLARTSGDERQQRVMGRLQAAIDRAVALCQRTLKYGRADEPVPEKKLISLTAVARDVEDALKDEAGVKIKWVNAVQKGFKVYADREQLFRALFNLCRNALEAMGDKGTLTIIAKEEGKRQLVGVLDTGPGIPAKARESLFIPFAGSTKGGGSGLGLAIAQEMVRAHGGEILLEKTDKDGSLFCISLPRKRTRKK